MNKITAILSLLLAGAINCPAAPAYVEPVDTSAVDTSGWSERPALAFAWASKDVHHRRFATPPAYTCGDTTVMAWRGERLGLEALVSAAAAAEPVAVKLSAFTDADGREVEMPGSEAMFMRYVWATDERRCGYADTVNPAPAYTIADMIDLPGASVAIPRNSVRPVWCTVEVPRDIRPGMYRATLTLCDEATKAPLDSLTLNVDVASASLPTPHDYVFYLDLWQQPYAISRYYGLEPWSDEHLRALEPYARLMARLGQRAVTTVLFYEPWGEQSNDKFEPMVKTVRRTDGSWHFDYTDFDRYVDFMAAQDIDQGIDCFSMVPWELKFRYFDEASGAYKFLDAPTSSPQYRELWTAALRSLKEHVEARGWLEKTYIYMDERGLDQMRDAMSVLAEAAPDLKIALAGYYHSELAPLMHIYSLGKDGYFSEEELALRRDKELLSLRYTCCADPEPSQFINNDPADGTYLPVHATAIGYDGYLHWSFQNWTGSPMTDSRFFMFGPGDTYFIYPDGRSSVRYERFAEGVQLSEKIRLLRERFTAAGDAPALCELDCALGDVRRVGMTASESSAAIISQLIYHINRLTNKLSQ